jgi:hypothetical protein
MDFRKLKSGKTRLRAKLNEYGSHIVRQPREIVDCKFHDNALDIAALSFIGGSCWKAKIETSCQGDIRFLVRFFPDQLETVKQALSIARTKVDNDEQALVLMCQQFIVDNEY